jgi:hypothetical protein
MGIGVKMTAKVRVPRGNLTDNLNKQVELIYRSAIREYARAAFSLVTIDIGQARASITPAGRIVRAALGGVSGRSPKAWEKRARPGYPFGRSVAAGKREGQATLNIEPGVRYEFTWTTSTQHFPLSQAGGITAIEAGRAAYRATVRQGFKTLRRTIRRSFRTKVLRT